MKNRYVFLTIFIFVWIFFLNSVFAIESTTSSQVEEAPCKYIWDCGSWTVCSSDGQQARMCNDKGTCRGIVVKPIESRDCSESLSNVELEFGQLELISKGSLAFNVNLIQTKNIEKNDVQIKYSIIDKDKNEIFSQIETRVIETEINYKKNLHGLKLVPGDYTLRVSMIYGNMKKANDELNFTVTEDGKISLGFFEIISSLFNIKFLIIAIITIIAVLLPVFIPIFVKILDIKYRRRLIKMENILKRKIVIPISVRTLDYRYRKRKSKK